jgi:hypothetical protein
MLILATNRLAAFRQGRTATPSGNPDLSSAARCSGVSLER